MSHLGCFNSDNFPELLLMGQHKLPNAKCALFWVAHQTGHNRPRSLHPPRSPCHSCPAFKGRSTHGSLAMLHHATAHMTQSPLPARRPQPRFEQCTRAIAQPSTLKPVDLDESAVRIQLACVPMCEGIPARLLLHFQCISANPHSKTPTEFMLARTRREEEWLTSSYLVGLTLRHLIPFKFVR